MVRSRYSATIDLTNLNSAHTLGILAVPLGSRVLDIGAADGSVARLLTERGCRVWAVEVDHEAAATARAWCEQVVVGDVEELDLREALSDMRFDAVVLLDVLPQLRHPERVLARAAALLAPGGLVIVSVPNVAHVDVRLKLLSGSFPYTETGLLDRKQLRLFDRAAAETLIASAGLRISERLRVVAPLGETELAADRSSFAPEIVAAALADPDAETYQFVFVAQAAAEPPDARTALPLASQLLARLQELDRQLEDGQRANGALQTEIEAQAACMRELEARLAEREAEVRASASVLASHEATLRERVAELESLAGQVKVLQSGLVVKDAYVASLRAEMIELAEAAAASEEYTGTAALKQHLAAQAAQITALQLQVAAGDSESVTVARLLARRGKHAAAESLRRYPPLYRTARWAYRRLRGYR